MTRRTGKPTVLIVDDEEDIRAGLRMVLSFEGYHVITAASGREGLDAVRRYPPDAIISDIAMPDLDGLDMCRCLRASQATRDIPIILFSSADPGALADCHWDMYFPKPTSPAVLLAGLAQLLRWH